MCGPFTTATETASVRKVDTGPHPDFVIGDFLTRRTFKYAPTGAGALESRRPRGEAIVLGVLQRFVPHDGTAWQHTLRILDASIRRMRDEPEPPPAPASSAGALLAAIERGVPPEAEQHLADYLPVARRLGELTGELHRVLASWEAPRATRTSLQKPSRPSISDPPTRVCAA